MSRLPFQLTCPMRGTTDMSAKEFAMKCISTHVPHAGHDFELNDASFIANKFQLTCPMRGTTKIPTSVSPRAKISTHVPHAGHDGIITPHYCYSLPFQLTCPMRGTTSNFFFRLATSSFQLTCPMRGTTWIVFPGMPFRGISTHVPHAGHDFFPLRLPSFGTNFNSRAPCGARRRGSNPDIEIPSFQLTCPMRGTTYLL